MDNYIGGMGVSVGGMGLDQWVGSGGVGCESVRVCGRGQGWNLQVGEVIPRWSS